MGNILKVLRHFVARAMARLLPYLQRPETQSGREFSPNSIDFQLNTVQLSGMVVEESGTSILKHHYSLAYKTVRSLSRIPLNGQYF